MILNGRLNITFNRWSFLITAISLQETLAVFKSSYLTETFSPESQPNLRHRYRLVNTKTNLFFSKRLLGVVCLDFREAKYVEYFAVR